MAREIFLPAASQPWKAAENEDLHNCTHDSSDNLPINIQLSDKEDGDSHSESTKPIQHTFTSREILAWAVGVYFLGVATPCVVRRLGRFAARR